MGAGLDGAFQKPRREGFKRPRGLEAVLGGWRESGAVWRNIVLDTLEPALEARRVEIPAALSPPVRRALAARGIDRLFSHQAEAYALAAGGRDVAVATPTASGKSLCYNLPVLDRLAQDPAGRALYLFPTKALSRDQEVALRAVMTDAGLEQGAITYDGDTPGDARRSARERSGILITNPDMLHAGILPHHAAWARLFSNLRFVVIDELHTYRGVFGSHLANVLRRLDRVARFHGSEPVFIFASATIGNPGDHAARMIGRPVEVVDESGAPRGPRHVMLYNPPVVNAELGIRQSYIKASVRLAEDLIRAEVPTLVFGQSRNNVEVMLKYLRDRLGDDVPAERVHAYRGGYLPGQRRDIERRLRDGDIGCVVATNALELGIDIGDLDAVVCAGYPGSVASLWQRFGRGGRRNDASLAVLVTASHALDQYFAGQPELLLGAPLEQARIDPDNVEILIQHLKCAAFELPFEEGERFGDLPGPSISDALEFLAQHEVLHPVKRPGGKTVFHWSTDAYPANHVSLRSVGWDNFVVIAQGEGQGDRTIGEMDWRSTHTMLHEQAIYQHAGEQFQVERLDFENHKAYVRKVEPDYYTTAMTHTKVSVIDASEQHSERWRAAMSVGLGEVSVVEKVVGYKKIKFHTHENVGYGEVRLPEMQMHTTAAWFTVDNGLIQTLDLPRPTVIDALRGLANAMHTVAAAGLMIDPRDLGHTLIDEETGSQVIFDPTIFLFDRFPGGVGLAPRVFDERREVMRRARLMVESCACSAGCPGCVGPVAAPEGDLSMSRKGVGLRILDALGIGR